ncbi:MAG TPA: MgtC/SapB family protein [Bryobacteraceae bacterium]|jgi:uncharacterized membrane protein (DUF4010 family)
MIDLPLSDAAAQLSAALLTGALIGAQREATPGDHPGLRDFLLIALAGGACGLLGNPWLSGAALLSIAGVLIVFHFEERDKRRGITTELAGVATFILALLAASPEIQLGKPIAIGTGILIAAFLEAKQRLQHLLRETITEPEFNATLAFITLVLVIYPLLPAGSYGWYEFFSPRQVWMFVILISAISYVGYFFEKFLGEEKGMVYTALLGGLASTSAVTLHLGHLSKVRPGEVVGLMRGFLIANTVQFPRTFLIIVLVNRELAMLCAWPLALMTITGIALAGIARAVTPHAVQPELAKADHGNPFRIRPALQFGALFTLVVFLAKWAAQRPGSGAFLGTSFLGGLVDVATVIAPASDLLRMNEIGMRTAELAVMLALGANALLKIVFAATTGTAAFTLRVAIAFLVWTAVAAAGMWLGTLY